MHSCVRVVGGKATYACARFLCFLMFSMIDVWKDDFQRRWTLLGFSTDWRCQTQSGISNKSGFALYAISLLLSRMIFKVQSGINLLHYCMRSCLFGLWKLALILHKKLQNGIMCNPDLFRMPLWVWPLQLTPKLNGLRRLKGLDEIARIVVCKTIWAVRIMSYSSTLLKSIA